VKSVDGILADLGVSSHQFDVRKRFSHRCELDMRMSQKNDLMLSVVNEYDDVAKKSVLDYGELKNTCFVENNYRGERTTDKTTDELKEFWRDIYQKVRNKILAQIYQAIRIEVNQEMDVLKEFVEQSLEVLIQVAG
jgi:16S rRNA (cytosine1402-N4)-methyltransferase